MAPRPRATIAAKRTGDPHLFSLDHVSLRHGAFEALRDVSLEFAAGSVTAVIGSSGSGKSSLLRLLIGLDLPSAGTVRVDGAPLLPRQRLQLRRSIGTVTQDGGLFPHLTALGNLALLPRHLGWSGARIETRAQELAALMQLPPELLRRYPAELSGGQRQRVAIARALACQSELVVLDEPTSALDVLVQARVLKLLKDLKDRRGLTYVFITHDLSVVRNIATRVAVFEKGKLVELGETDAIFANPTHAYTRRLIGAVPVVSREEAALRDSIMENGNA